MMNSMIVIYAVSTFFQIVMSERYKCKCSCDQCYKPSKCCEVVCVNECQQNPFAVMYVPYPVPIFLPKESDEEPSSWKTTEEPSTPEKPKITSYNTPIIQIITKTPATEIDIEVRIKKLLKIMTGKSTMTSQKTTIATKEVTTSDFPPTTTIIQITTTTTKTPTKPPKNTPKVTTNVPTVPSPQSEEKTTIDLCKDVPSCIPKDIIRYYNHLMIGTTKSNMFRTTDFKENYRALNYQTFTKGVEAAKYNYVNFENPVLNNEEIVELPLRRGYLMKQRQGTARQQSGPVLPKSRRNRIGKVLKKFDEFFGKELNTLLRRKDAVISAEDFEPSEDLSVVVLK